MLKQPMEESQLIQRKKEIARIYNLAAPGYDLPALKFFPLTAACLVDFLKVKPGQTVLDVATGTGVAAIMAAEGCRPGGRVIGIDIAEEMLEVAATKIKRAGISNLDLQTGDGERLDFPDSTFDIVLSNAGLFFMADMWAGLQEWQRVCKPGGQVGFSGFGPAAFQPLSDLFEKLLRHYEVTFPTPSRPFSWQRLTGPEEYRALVEKAGYYLANAEEWWQIIWNSGFRGPVTQLTPSQLEEFKAEHLASVTAIEGASGIWLDIPLIVAIGRKA